MKKCTDNGVGTLREQNEYLEEIQVTIINLVYIRDGRATVKRIDAYKRDNKKRKRTSEEQNLYIYIYIYKLQDK